MTYEEETAAMARLYAEGLSLRQIAPRLGREKSTIRKRLLAAGVKLRPRGCKYGSRPALFACPGGVAMTYEEETAAMARLYAEGLCCREVGARFGQEATTVRDRLTKAGFQLRPRGGVRKPPAAPKPLPVGRPAAANASVTAWEEARMVQLHVHEGLSPVEIGARLGRTRQTVSRCLRRLGQLRVRVVVAPEVPEVLRKHIPAACHLAKETLRRLALPVTPEYDAQDWFSLARLLALQALASYRPEKGAAWSSWVIYRVRWDLANELRRTSPFTRKEWKGIREAAFAADPGLADPARQGEWEERARQLRLGRQQVSWEQWCAGWEEDDENWRPQRRPDWITAPDPEAWLLARAVREAVAALPDRLRYVVCQFQRGFVDKELARAMGISPTRVHQLHEEGRQRLREALAEWA